MTDQEKALCEWAGRQREVIRYSQRMLEVFLEGYGTLGTLRKLNAYFQGIIDEYDADTRLPWNKTEGEDDGEDG